MKKMVRTLAILIILTMLCSLFTSCGDADEIDDEVYVLALGIDKGVTNKVKITIQYATYKSGGGSEKKEVGGGEKGKESNQSEGSIIHTVEASTILEAIDLYGMAISRRVSLKHTKIILFSEDFAKAGVGYYMGPMARYRETRRVMNIAVVKGTAQDFIKENKTNIGDSISKAIELMAMQSENTSFFAEATFNSFYKAALSTYSQPYATYAGINDFKNIPEEKKEDGTLITNRGFMPGELPRDGVAKREFVGTALFDGDKMVGSLDSLETRYFLMVIGKFKKGIMTLKDKRDPEAAIPLDIRLGRKPRIRAQMMNGKPVIDVHIELEGDIGAIQSRIPYEKMDMIKELNMQVEEVVEKGMLNMIKKTQELNSDIFGFGGKVAGRFATIQEWEQYNWLKHYKEAEIKVEVKANIRRTGLLIHSAPIRDAKS